MFKNRKMLVWGGATILLLVLLLIFWVGGRNVLQVKFADATYGEVAASVACSGVVASEGADLSSKLGGRILWIGVDVGSRVSQGDVLVKLDTYDQAKRDWDSVSSLYAQGLASKQQLENAKTALASASLVSPITGVVVKKAMNVGEVAVPGEAIVSVANTGNIWVDVDIDEIDIGDAREGAEARVSTDAYPGQIFYGRVSWISKAAQVKQKISLSSTGEEDRIFKAKVSFLKLEPSMKPGMSVDVDIVYDKKENVLIVPRDAISFRESKSFVYVLRGGRVMEKEVELGSRDIGNVEIKSGLKAGDKVAITNLDKLKNWARVRVSKQ